MYKLLPDKLADPERILKETGNPELAVAVSVTGASLKETVGGGLNIIVWVLLMSGIALTVAVFELMVPALLVTLTQYSEVVIGVIIVKVLDLALGMGLV
jgi:hypothetical protein